MFIELIIELINVSIYKVNTEKLLIFLYISCKQLQIEKNLIYQKCIKDLRDKFRKYLQDLFAENYKTLLTEIKEDLNKRRYVLS